MGGIGLRIDGPPHFSLAMATTDGGPVPKGEKNSTFFLVFLGVRFRFAHSSIGSRLS